MSSRSKTRHPFVIAPNGNMASHLCNIFQIPKNQVRNPVASSLMGFGRDACFIVYTEGWRSGDLDKILEVLEPSGCTIIFCPEIQQVHR